MRTVPKWSAILARTSLAGPLAMAGALFAFGCGGEGGMTSPPPPPPPPSGQADLVVSVAGTSAVSTGETLSLTITARNAGGMPAIGLAVTLELPSSLVASSASDNGVITAGSVTWSGLGDLAGGASRSLTIAAVAPAIGPVSAKASGTTTSVDATPTNNDGSATAANLQIIISFDPVATIQGESAGDQFGWLIEELGDLDNDGVSDFVVTAIGAASGNGRAYVYSGASRVELFRFTGQAGDALGTGVDLIGDVDGDGVSDLVIGAPGPGQSPGRAYVVSGSTGLEIYSVAGENAGDRFGISVGRLGDANGDGVADFLVGATGHDDSIANSGRVYILSGVDGAILATHNSLASGSRFGAAVGGIGDLDGDNIPDFGVGAPNAPGGGRVYVLSGSDGELVYPSIVQGGGTRLGEFWLNTPGDVNGDGTPDIFTPDILHSGAGGQAGRAYVFSGSDGSVIHSIDGEASGDNFGIGRGVPDANEDGVGDLFAAGWLSSEGATAAGKAYVYSGSDATLLRTFTSTTAGENLGFDAIGIGDVTGDGIPDYLISGGISATSSGHVHVVAGIR